MKEKGKKRIDNEIEAFLRKLFDIESYKSLSRETWFYKIKPELEESLWQEDFIIPVEPAIDKANFRDYDFGENEIKKVRVNVINKKTISIETYNFIIDFTNQLNYIYHFEISPMAIENSNKKLGELYDNYLLETYGDTDLVHITRTAFRLMIAAVDNKFTKQLQAKS